MRYAISDIHGHCETFLRLLDRLQLSSSDELYLLGDYVDRGPDSCGVIESIFELKADGYQVHCLKGNHEVLMYRACIQSSRTDLINWLHNAGGKDTIASYPKLEINTTHLEWMEQLPHYFDLGDYYLVHAGLNFKGGTPLEDKTAMLWIRDWYADIRAEYLGGRTIVHGHTPIPPKEILQMVDPIWPNPVINIDAGCYRDRNDYGLLCALNLDSRDLTFEARVEL
ncbi:MAG: metallophosphoesterase family protein [Bacteroidota bacterium]